MKCAAILNACSDGYQLQAETLFSFIRKNLAGVDESQSVIIFSDETGLDQTIRHAPTTEISLLKVSRYQPEMILDALEGFFEQHQVDLILFASDFAGSELSVRLAYRLQGSSLVGVDGIEFDNNRFICHKSVYSNHLRGVFELRHKPFCVSLKKGFVDPVSIPDSHPHKVVSEQDLSHKVTGFVKNYKFMPDEKTNHLAVAPMVLVAGQGVGSKKAIQELAGVANQMGAELAVSRPVAMNAWTEMERMVGISGTMIKPELCMVVAASGAAALMAGIENSTFIISINHDQQAPIVKQCDVAVIDDYQAVIQALSRIIVSSGE